MSKMECFEVGCSLRRIFFLLWFEWLSSIGNQTKVVYKQPANLPKEKLIEMETITS
jgi:hypothetical protein